MTGCESPDARIDNLLFRVPHLLAVHPSAAAPGSPPALALQWIPPRDTPRGPRPHPPDPTPHSIKLLLPTKCLQCNCPGSVLVTNSPAAIYSRSTKYGDKLSSTRHHRASIVLFSMGSMRMALWEGSTRVRAIPVAILMGFSIAADLQDLFNQDIIGLLYCKGFI